MKNDTREVLRATDYESELIIQKFEMARQYRQCVVTGCSSTAVDVPFTKHYVYCISASSAFGFEAVRMQLNADAELSFPATRHVVEWHPTAAIIYHQMSIWKVRY